MRVAVLFSMCKQNVAIRLLPSDQTSTLIKKYCKNVFLVASPTTFLLLN